MITVKIPASTSNLGPGFDCLGMAVNLHNIFHVYQNVNELTIESNVMHDEISRNEDNLIYKSMKRLFDYAGKKIPPVKIVEKVSIPVSRGLGSSASCIVGGLAAANKMLGDPYDSDEILNLACKMEGHPDNVAPAILGGLVVSTIEDNKVLYTRHSVNNIKLMAAIPDFTLSTKASRSVLPQTINYKDAVFNTGRSTLLAASLITGNMSNLKYAVQDKLHQQYRLPLIKDGEKVFEQAKRLGAEAVFISGSGPTIMAFISSNEVIKMLDEFCKTLDTNWTVRELEVDNSGVKISDDNK